MSGGIHESAGFCNPQSLGAIFSAYSGGGTTITPSSLANTKGAWASLGTLSGDVTNLYVKLYYVSQTSPDTGVSFDIAVGLSGSQVVLVSNISIASNSNYDGYVQNFIIPIALVSGTEIWARAAANAASSTSNLEASVVGYDAGFRGNHFAAADTLGYVSVGRGTAFTAGNGLKGSYSQIVASTAEDYEGVVLLFDNQGSAGALGAVIDVAIGASGSEQVVIGDMSVFLSGSVLNGAFDCFDVQVPAGSRIAVRGSCVEGATYVAGLTILGIY